LASDFDFVLSQLLADDGDAARSYRHTHKTGGSVEGIEPTPLELAEQLWTLIFPGRSLEWKDWSPVVNNDRQEVVTYGANQMSDGERAALYLLSKVLLAAPGTVLVIDEPETHFHSELAVRLWDALEKVRLDLRFVYVTHDLTFGLSREPADFLLADPVRGLTVINVDSGIPAEIRRDILGAASFSYYASRAVFCEGEDQSYDKAFLAAWFSGRDTVVKAVGSSDSVRQCVQAFNSAELVDNLDAVGIVDRDHRSNEELASMAEILVVLPFHEIEALVCVPAVADQLAAHLAVELEGGVEAVIRGSVSADDARRVAHERTKMRNVVENQVSAKPSAWDETSLAAHYESVNASVATSVDALAIFKEELALADEVRSSSDVEKILELFPSKGIAGKVASALGVKVGTLFDLLTNALTTSEGDPLYELGKKLEPALLKLSLPARVVAERPQASEPQAA
jgi:hypothetical protein